MKQDWHSACDALLAMAKLEGQPRSGRNLANLVRERRSRVSTNVYLNNLTPLTVNLTVTFPGNPIAAGDWGQLQTSLQPFDANNQVAWVSRNKGIHNSDSYTM